MSLFPMMTPRVSAQTEPLPVYRDVAWDTAAGTPVYVDGRPAIVEGLEAIKGWIWRSLMTARYRYEIHSWDYGSQLEDLIGQSYTAELKRAEAARYTREALLINPYISAVWIQSVIFVGDMLTIDLRVDTIYGEVDIRV